MPETEFEPRLPSVVVDDDASTGRQSRSTATGSTAWRIAGLAAVVAVAAAAYWWWQRQAQPPAAPAPPPAVETPSAPAAAAEPAIRHPIEDARTALAPSGEARDQLPAMSDSDAAIRAALSGLPGAFAFERLFHPEEIVRRFVATVDNLPRRSVSPQVMVAKPVPGWLTAAMVDGRLAIGNDNAARYAPYVQLADTVDPKALVALYVRFYPWFQQAYRDLGYPNGYFNDRLIDTIDDLLATPDASEPVALTQPHVLYEFARPDLESLSAGQKIMLRMGHDNASHVKTKLRELRRMLTGAVSPP